MTSAGALTLNIVDDVRQLFTYHFMINALAAGTAVAGPPEEVITSESLSRLYGVPIEVLRASDGRLVVVGQPEAPHVHTPRHD